MGKEVKNLKEITQKLFQSTFADQLKTKIWLMGTSWILHIRRFSSFVSKLNSLNLEKDQITNGIISFEKYIIFDKNNKSKTRYKFIFEYDENKKKIFKTKSSGKDRFDWFEEMENIGRDYAESTYRQLLEVWEGMGFIKSLGSNSKFIDNKFVFSTFDYLDLDSNLNNEINFLNLIANRCKNDIYFKSKKSTWRDISYSWMILLALKLKYISFNDLRDFGVVNFRSRKIGLTTFNTKKVEVGFKKLISTDTNSNYFENINMPKMIFQNFLNCYIDFFKRNSENLEIYNLTDSQIEILLNNNSLEKSKNRKGQNLYRKSVLDDRRIKGMDFYDLSINDEIKIESIVQAAHILPYSKCGTEEEKVDINNCLLMDPSFHNWFDKNIIVFDEEGKLFIRKKEYDDVLKLIPKNRSLKIKNKVLNNKTRMYLIKRIEASNLNFNDYLSL